MLIAEDRAEDVEILKLAFNKAQVNVRLRFVQNGEEVMQYLKGQRRFADRAEYPMPRLLILDLKMPMKNGFDVLQRLRSEPELRRLVVVIFTCSDLQQDINRAFDLGANAYLLKPAKFEQLKEMVRALDEFWCKLNRFPNCNYVQRFNEPTWESQ